MEKFCCRCKEDFPVSNSSIFKMGEMRRLTEVKNPLIRAMFSHWESNEAGGHLCGNCYFDLTD